MQKVKFLWLILGAVLIANIIFLCSPVCYLGNYTGIYNVENYYCAGHSHVSAKFERKVDFSFSTATYKTNMVGTTCAYDNNSWGNWARIDNNIVVRLIDDDYINHIYLEKYERKSVFTLVYKDNLREFALTNGVAVVIQVIFAALYIVLFCFIYYYKVVVKNEEAHHSHNKTTTK